MPFSTGEYDKRALVRSDLDLLRNDACIRHIMPIRVSGGGYLGEYLKSGLRSLLRGSAVVDGDVIGKIEEIVETV